MSERYTRLYVLPQNLYLDGAPVMIAAGALLKDNVTGKILAQLKLRNLYKSPLTACKVHIRAFEPGGAELKGIDEYSYLDLFIRRGVDFGSQEPIYLADNTTRQFSAGVIQAVFEDGTVWQSPAAEWTQLPFKRQQLKDKFSDNEVQKQYAIEVGEPCEYVPESAGGLFLCTCGAINLENDKTCSKCHREIKTLVDALDKSFLKPKMDERLAKEEAKRKEQERIAEEKRKEQERIAEEKRLEEEQRLKIAREKALARKKILAKTAIIAAPILCVVIAFIILLNTVIIPNIKYNNAIALLEQGEYAKAATLFSESGNYKDSRQQSQSLWNKIAKIASFETISAGASHTVGLKSDGIVVAVGDNNNDKCDVSSWKDIVAVSAGYYHTVGLKSDGTVFAVGSNKNGQCDVSGWKDIVSVSAGDDHTIGLKSDSTVVAVGGNYLGQCDVSGWKDIVSVSAGGSHTVGLKSDGTVVAVGYNYYGQCDVSGWKDIVSVSAGDNHTIGLKSDGTVIAVGDNQYGQCNVSGWNDIAAVSAGDDHTVGLKSDGTVVAVGHDDWGQCFVSGWQDIVAISAGDDHTVGLKSDGTVVTVGHNDKGQCDVSDWKDIKIPVR